MLNVRDLEKTHREMQVIERDITNVQNAKAALEDKGWELDAKLVTKLEEFEGLAERCNQALKRYECTTTSTVVSSFFDFVPLHSSRTN